jgi:hypothetical protein
LTTPTLYQWSQKREPPTAYSVPTSILCLNPGWHETIPQQAQRIAAEVGELPAGKRTLLADWLGAHTMRTQSVVSMHLGGIDRTLTTAQLRAVRDAFKALGVTFDAAWSDLEDVCNEDHPAFMANLDALWDYDEFYPFTPADFRADTFGPARYMIRRKANRIRNDFLRWALETSNYLPVRAGRVANWDCHGASGNAELGVVRDMNTVHTPSGRPGDMDSPVCYVTRAGDAERCLKNVRVLLATSRPRWLVPIVSDGAYSAGNGHDGSALGEWRALMAGLLGLGVREFWWWSMDPDRERAREVMGDVMRGAAA